MKCLWLWNVTRREWLTPAFHSTFPPCNLSCFPASAETRAHLRFPWGLQGTDCFSEYKELLHLAFRAFDGAVKSLIYSEKYTCISLQDHIVLLLLQHSETAFQITPRQIWLSFRIKVRSPINHSSVQKHTGDCYLLQSKEGSEQFHSIKTQTNKKPFPESPLSQCSKPQGFRNLYSSQLRVTWLEDSLV